MSSHKVIVGARESKAGKDKVSHQAQHDAGLKWAQANGAEIVDTFQDLGVSAGKVRILDRPDFKKFTDEENLHTWDTVVFSKVDRAFRSTDDVVDFARWCSANKKKLVFADDGIAVDYRSGSRDQFETIMAELFLTLGAFFGRIELARFKERAKDAQAQIRQTDRFSGKPPFGFEVVEHPSGKGKTLIHNPDEQRTLHKAAELLLGGKSIKSICKELDSLGMKPAQSEKWQPRTLARTLANPAIQGNKIHAGKIVLDKHGNPIRQGEPSFDAETWERIQTALAERKLSGPRRVESTNPYRGVTFCGHCGKALTLGTDRIKSRNGKTEYTYYRLRCWNGCRDNQGKPVQIRLDVVESFVSEQFLQSNGDRQVTEKRFIPGEDRSYELADIKQRIERLRAESDAGLLTTKEDQDNYLSRLKGLVARRDEIEASPVRLPRWEVVETGKTYAEVWADPDTDRGEVLRKDGFRFELFGRHHYGIVVPESWPEPVIEDAEPIPDDLEERWEYEKRIEREWGL